MAQQRRSQPSAQKFFGLLFTGFIAILWIIGSTSVTQAAEGEWKGHIEAMPAAGLIGNWVVEGRAFTTTDATEFRQDKGTFAIGVCVEVEYVGQSSPFAANKIATKSSDDCSSTQTTTPATTTTTPNATQTPIPSGTPDASPSATSSATPLPAETREVKALIERMPTSGLLGTWLLGGVEYPITANTRLRQEKGPFVVGACVEIEYTPNTTPWTVYKLATKHADDCNPSGTPVSTPSGTPTGSPTTLPNGTEAELFGILQSFPAGLLGEWNIGGMTFTASPNTEFDQRNGAFTVGATVKVHFTTDGSGVHLAREIETKFKNDVQGNDDNGNGVLEGAEGHAFGRVTSLPAGDRLGDWQIGGITYTVNAATQLTPAPSSFTVDILVRVNYFVDNQGQRLARKIQISTDSGGADDSNHFVLYSFIKNMPPTGRLGEWQLDNVQFLATATTQFKADHGQLGLGAYVKVEYFISDGRPILHELETHVPPGAGDSLTIGNIQSIGGALMAAGTHAVIWQIGSESYTVTPATDLNDQQSGLVIGATALVNSYRAADGSQVATQIRGIALDQRLYLPVITRSVTSSVSKCGRRGNPFRSMGQRTCDDRGRWCIHWVMRAGDR